MFENPIRKLNISNDMLTTFMLYRQQTIDDFKKLNENFPKQQFELCIDCWLDIMYSENEGQITRFNLLHLLAFSASTDDVPEH